MRQGFVEIMWLEETRGVTTTTPDKSDVVRHDRLRWFGHLECKNVDDWMSAGL